MAISGRPILDDFDDPVQALTDGIGQGSVDEGQDVDEVSTQCADERAQCGNATAQGSGHPGPEKLLCRGPIAVCPEVLKLVLEHPGAVDAAIGVPQAIQEAGVALGATSRERWTPKFGQLAKVGSRPRRRSLACHGRDGVIRLS